VKLLTPEAVAEQLAVSRSTVLRMIQDGALPAVCLRSGRRKKVWRVRQEVLEKWVMSREKRQPGKQPEPTGSGSTKGMENNGLDTDALESKSSALGKLP
jgi:excisionase family DNA binding protein